MQIAKSPPVVVVPDSLRPHGKRHNVWTVAVTTLFVLLFSSSTRSVFSILIEPLMKEFGWSRSVTSLPASVNLIVLGLTGPGV